MGAAQVLAEGAVVTRAVFEAGGTEFTWADIVVSARLRGDWDAVERDARGGLTALAAMHARGEEIDRGALDGAAAEFRYARDLLSGDEMEAWLARWDLSSTEWTEWVARTLAREHDDGSAAEALDEDEVETAAGVEAICSGALERWASELAARVAVGLARGATDGGTSETEAPPARGVLAVEPPAWDAGVEKVRSFGTSADDLLAEAVDEAAVERELALRRLDWLAFRCRLLDFPEECMAREALLCVYEDGWSLDDVAHAAHAAPQQFEFVLEDVPPDLQPLLLAAKQGEVTGPVRTEGGHGVILVERKSEPEPGDPAVAERARRKALGRIVGREVETRVRWHERV